MFTQANTTNAAAPFFARLMTALRPKPWRVTLYADDGNTISCTIHARAYAAAMREARAMTDTDYYSFTIAAC